MKTTTLTKSTLSGHVLNCLAMFNDIYGKVFARGKVGKRRKINNSCLCFSWAVSFVIELDMPLRSVSLIQESFIHGLGFNPQTLNGSL